jgi:hypothetical protein
MINLLIYKGVIFMAGKYKQRINSVDCDLTSLCEPKVHDAAPGFGTKFTGEGSFQKAGTDTKNITLDGYTVDGTKVTAVKKGYYPTFKKKLWYSSTPNANGYALTRTDSSLTIGSSTFKTSDFRDGVIPHELIVLLVGAGGGGGGIGRFSPGKDKDGFYAIVGGAGGGGAICVGRIRLYDGFTYYITVGSGGTAGTNKDEAADATGGTGGTGGSCSVYHTKAAIAANCILSAGGGTGGTGGAPKGDSDCTPGTGGAGGSGSIKSTIHNINGQCVSGGGGNYFNNHNRTAVAALTYTPTPGTGAPAQTYGGINSDGSSYNKSDKSNAANNYFSGGCSYEAGYRLASNSIISGGVGGGGGAAAYGSLPGFSGYVEIYY